MSVSDSPCADSTASTIAAHSERLTPSGQRPSGSRFECRRALLAIAAGVSVAIASGAFGIRHNTWFEFTFLGHLYWLGLGMALAIASVVVGTRAPRFPPPLRQLVEHPGLCWLIAFGLYVLTVLAFYPAPFPVAPFTGFEAWTLQFLQGLVALFLLIPIFFANPNRGLPARAAGRPVILWLGLISYGLYLWQVTPETDLGFGSAHEGFLVVLVGTVLFAVPASVLSYYLVERPLMRHKGVPFRSWWHRTRRKAGSASS